MPETGTCTSIINLRYQDGSEGSPTNPAKFNNQDYAQLKADSLRRGRLFVDRTFPPDNRSLGDLPDMSRSTEDQVQWLRPAVKNFKICFFSSYTHFSYIYVFTCISTSVIFFPFCLVQDILKIQNISSEVSFCLKGASRFDFGQGYVGKQGFMDYS